MCDNGPPDWIPGIAGRRAGSADRIATRIEGAPEEESRRHDVREGWISFWGGPMCDRGLSDE